MTLLRVLNTRVTALLPSLFLSSLRNRSRRPPPLPSPDLDRTSSLCGSYVAAYNAALPCPPSTPTMGRHRMTLSELASGMRGSTRRRRCAAARRSFWSLGLAGLRVGTGDGGRKGDGAERQESTLAFVRQMPCRVEAQFDYFGMWWALNSCNHNLAG
ncbi:hypothetical protein DFP72DRAFT_872231 [Ephemerocybe angulata]|uniref:Uncharacterized protein n=1 Tax=Ephemerocybe angulata TaxID=980116 RepID=A0A8H6IGK2_9AGAR|nr:hypothetical protein DFP72DRAFT_872231 [Tulosesus angulatus]